MSALSIKHIDQLTPAGLYAEFSRLMAHDGGSVNVSNGMYTIFTVASQHVTATGFDAAIKKALVMERFRAESKMFWSLTEYREWMDKNEVPAHLRL